MRTGPPAPSPVAGRWGPLLLGLCLASVPGRLAAAQPGAAAGLGWRFGDGEAPPFTREELESAVQLRRVGGEIRGPADPGDVELAWAGPGMIEARSPKRRRVVALGEARGPEAARLVALAIVDVLRPFNLPAAEPIELARWEDASPASGSEARAAATGADRAGALTLVVSGAVSRGTTTAGFALEPYARVLGRVAGAPGSGQLAVFGEVGYGQGRGQAGSQIVTLHLLPLRLGVALGKGPWALGVAGLYQPYFTRGLVLGGRGARGALFGGHVDVERRFPLGRRLDAALAAGLDLLASAVELRVGGEPLLGTGRIAPALRLGLAWRAR